MEGWMTKSRLELAGKASLEVAKSLDDDAASDGESQPKKMRTTGAQL